MITELKPATHAGVTEVGGKAVGLVRPQRAGLVPQAWFVPAAVSLDSAARETLQSTELPQWWSAVSAEFPDSQSAVRSSAPWHPGVLGGVFMTTKRVSESMGICSARVVIESCLRRPSRWPKSTRSLPSNRADLGVGVRGAGIRVRYRTWPSRSPRLPHDPKTRQVAVMALLQPKLCARQTQAISPCRGNDP